MKDNKNLYEDINLQYYGTAVFLARHASTQEERRQAHILSVLLEDMILKAWKGEAEDGQK